MEYWKDVEHIKMKILLNPLLHHERYASLRVHYSIIPIAERSGAKFFLWGQAYPAGRDSKYSNVFLPVP